MITSVASTLGVLIAVCIRQDLKGMVKDLLKSFYRASGKKPVRLIFYRDGVSEGQFAEVQRFEITQVRL